MFMYSIFIYALGLLRAVLCWQPAHHNIEQIIVSPIQQIYPVSSKFLVFTKIKGATI